MKQMSGVVFALVMCLCSGDLLAQDVSGTWQGYLPGSVKERLVLTVSKSKSGAFSGQLLAVDHAQTNTVDPITFQDGLLRFKAAVEEEKSKVLQAAEQEIAAATAQARRHIQQYAAELAVDQAARKLVITAETDRLLIESFARRLGGDDPKKEQN